MNLPELGVGVVFFQGVEPFIKQHADLVDVIEVEAQTFWYGLDEETGYRLNDAALDHLASWQQPKIIHGVAFPVGSCRAPDPRHAPFLVETIERIGARWASEHLSFNSACNEDGPFGAGFLLPPLQTEAGAEAAAETIRHVAAQLSVPFGFETGVSYLRSARDELSDGSFFGRVANKADCGILLDIHNLYCNERNGRQNAMAALAEMPLDRVWEVHVAGGRLYRNYWVDAHSGTSPPEMFELAREVISRLPNLKAIIFEMLPEFAYRLDDAAFRAQLETMHELWALRGTKVGQPFPQAATVVEAEESTLDLSRVTPEDWEDTLGALTIGRQPRAPLEESALARRLEADPGLAVYRDMAASARAGIIADALKLTMRAIILQKGEPFFGELMRRFWTEQPPCIFASVEAEAFAAFLERQRLEMPFVYDALRLERASMRVRTHGSAQKARLRCEPAALVRALGAGRLPEGQGARVYELELTPD